MRLHYVNWSNLDPPLREVWSEPLKLDSEAGTNWTGRRLSEDRPWLGIGVSVSSPKNFCDGRAGLHQLARRHSLSRNLIRLWIRKYEAGEF